MFIELKSNFHWSFHYLSIFWFEKAKKCSKLICSCDCLAWVDCWLRLFDLHGIFSIKNHLVREFIARAREHFNSPGMISSQLSSRRINQTVANDYWVYESRFRSLSFLGRNRQWNLTCVVISKSINWSSEVTATCITFLLRHCSLCVHLNTRSIMRKIIKKERKKSLQCASLQVEKEKSDSITFKW